MTTERNGKISEQGIGAGVMAKKTAKKTTKKATKKKTPALRVPVKVRPKKVLQKVGPKPKRNRVRLTPIEKAVNNSLNTPKPRKGPAKSKDDNHGKDGRFKTGNDVGFAPGETANHLGSTGRTKLLTDAMRGWLEKPATCLPFFEDMALEHRLPADKITVSQLLALNHLFHVGKGNAGFMKEMYERVEGKTLDRVAAQITNKMSVTDLMTAIKFKT